MIFLLFLLLLHLFLSLFLHFWCLRVCSWLLFGWSTIPQVVFSWASIGIPLVDLFVRQLNHILSFTCSLARTKTGIHDDIDCNDRNDRSINRSIDDEWIMIGFFNHIGAATPIYPHLLINVVECFMQKCDFMVADMHFCHHHAVCRQVFGTNQTYRAIEVRSLYNIHPFVDFLLLLLLVLLFFFFIVQWITVFRWMVVVSFYDQHWNERWPIQFWNDKPQWRNGHCGGWLVDCFAICHRITCGRCYYMPFFASIPFTIKLLMRYLMLASMPSDGAIETKRQTATLWIIRIDSVGKSHGRDSLLLIIVVNGGLTVLRFLVCILDVIAKTF